MPNGHVPGRAGAPTAAARSVSPARRQLLGQSDDVTLRVRDQGERDTGHGHRLLNHPATESGGFVDGCVDVVHAYEERPGKRR